jgi:hypothetical protein
VYCARKTGIKACRVPITLHRPDVREQGFIHRTLIAPSDPKNCFAVSGYNKHAVLPCTREIIEVGFAEYEVAYFKDKSDAKICEDLLEEWD